MSSEIQVIEVHDPRDLPKSYFPFIGTLDQAKAAIIADRKKDADKRIYPDGVNTIYHFVSLVKSGWYILAIDPEPHTQVSILVDVEEVVNG